MLSSIEFADTLENFLYTLKCDFSHGSLKIVFFLFIFYSHFIKLFIRLPAIILF